MKVSVYEAKSKLSQMINSALEGEEVVITRNGKDTVKLTPVKQTKGDWIGMYKGQIKIHDNFDEPLDDETLGFFTGESETFLDRAMKEDQQNTQVKE